MIAAPPTLAPPGHIPALDGLRGGTVLLVVVAHTILIGPATGRVGEVVLARRAA